MMMEMELVTETLDLINPLTPLSNRETFIDLTIRNSAKLLSDGFGQNGARDFT
jgi:hypothetical protein